MIIPDFIREKFKMCLYTIEYEGIVGGQTMTLYVDEYEAPVFCNTDGIVFNSIEEIVTYLHRFVDFKPFFENNPIVYEYSMNCGQITKISVGTAWNLANRE